MTIELLFNIILFVFFVVCFGMSFGLVNQTKSDVLGSAFWPQIILVLLLLCLAWNIYKVIRNIREHPGQVEKINFAQIKGFFTGKMFIGIVITALMAILLEPLGFLPTTFLFLAAYGILLGERKVWKILVISLVLDLLLYVVFFKGLSIMLPRGMGPLRDFSLWIESLLRGGR